MAIFWSVVEKLLLPSLLLALLVGSVFAILVGAGLMLRSEAMFRLFGSMNRWVSTRKAMGELDKPRNMEGALHRQRLFLGFAVIVGSALSLPVLIWKFEVGAFVFAFHRVFPAAATELVALCLRWLLLIGDSLALLAGISLVFFPQLLAKLEAQMNRWYSPRAAAKDMDIMHMTIDDWTRANPRTAGLLIVVLAVFVALNLGMFVFGRH